MGDERWLYLPEHGCVYAIDEITGEPIRHYPVAVTSVRYGPRLGRLPALERALRGYLAEHDEDWTEFYPDEEDEDFPSGCKCDLCAAARALLAPPGAGGGPPESTEGTQEPS